MPAFEALTDFWNETLGPAITDTLIPAIKNLSENIMPLINGAIDNVVLPAFEGFVSFLETVAPPAIQFVSDKIGGVQRILYDIRERHWRGVWHPQ